MASTAISMAYSETRAHALIRGCMLCSSRVSDAVRAGIFHRGEVAEPGLRRTPGERVDSKGSRGFKSPPLRQAVCDLRQSPEKPAKFGACARLSRLRKGTGELSFGPVLGLFCRFLSAARWPGPLR